MDGVFRQDESNVLVILLVEIEMRFTIVRGGVVLWCCSCCHECNVVVSCVLFV
jgi:hypothetical protein